MAGNEPVEPEMGESSENTSVKDVYWEMEQYGTVGATSIQRVYPTVNMEVVSQLDLSEEHAAALDLFLGRRDLSSQPLEGDMTDDLFLAHRDKTSLTVLGRRKRRRTLEMMTNISGLENREELQELCDAEDAESETSVVEVESVFVWGENGEEWVKMGGHDQTWLGQSCGADCALKGWDLPTAPTTLPVDLSQPSSAERSKSDATSDPGAIYAPVPANYIRVLEVHPGENDALLSVALHQLDLDAATGYDNEQEDGDAGNKVSNYEALSYTWGSPNPECLIECNGAPTRIPRNLHSALRHLRRPGKPRFLWADALCINQLDNQDRSIQVRQMLKIYKRASRVIIWLGDFSSRDARAATKLMRLLDQAPVRRQVLDATHDAACTQNLAHAYRVLEELYAQPWFRRTWIRQEVGAAKKVAVRCGDEAVSWGLLKRTTSRLSDVRKKLQESGFTDLPPTTPWKEQTLQHLRRDWVYGQSVFGNVAVSGSWYYWHGGGLLDLLLTGTQFDVTDPRDRVYAVLGMAREPIEGAIDDGDVLFPHLDRAETFERMTIDYDDSVSQIYQRLAKTLINRDLNLDILCVLKEQKQESAGAASRDLPSWTPDWRDRQLGELSDFLTLRFFASGFTRAERQLHSELGKLRVKAYAVDRVEELIGATATAWDLLYERGEAIILSEGEMENRKTWKKEPVFKDLDLSSDWRRCCKTMRGHVALVPLGARPGDIIFVVLGARLPFILRRNQGQEVPARLEGDKLVLGTDFGTAVVLGPCILPGFMQGEVFSLVGREEALDLTLV